MAPTPREMKRALAESMPTEMRTIARAIYRPFKSFVEPRLAPQGGSSPAAPCVFTLPDKSASEVLPPIESVLNAEPEPMRSRVAGLFAGVDTVQLSLLRKQSEEALTAFAHQDKAPLPLQVDRAMYFGDQHVSYWLDGLGDYLYLKALLLENGVRDDQSFRFFDFACSTGRVARHFLAHSPRAEVYGCDLAANALRWLRQHLDGGVFFQSGLLPHLPMADNTFDLVYAGSIFTHLDEFEETWLLELRRIMKPGAMAFVSFHSERTWNSLRPGNPVLAHMVGHPFSSLEAEQQPVDVEFFRRPMPAERVVVRLIEEPLRNMNAFHATSYIQRKWGAIFDVKRIVERAHGQHQDGVLLLKRG